MISRISICTIYLLFVFICLKGIQGQDLQNNDAQDIQTHDTQKGNQQSQVQQESVKASLQQRSLRSSNQQNLPYGFIQGKLWVPNDDYELGDIRVVIHEANKETRSSYATRDGIFMIDNLIPGTHNLEVQAFGWDFPQYRVEVGKKLGRVTIFRNFDGAAITGSPPILKPTGVIPLKKVTQQNNVFSFLKSPYGIMIAVGAVFMILPNFLKLNQDDVKEIREMYSKQKEDKDQKKITQ